MRSDLYTHLGRDRHPPLLLKDVIDRQSEDRSKIGWTLALMEIYDHERDLAAGRFVNFDRQPQEWRATVRLEGPLAGDRLKKLRHDVAIMINWIAEHVETGWSLDYAERDDIRYLDFSFADSHFGFAFKMLFA